MDPWEQKLKDSGIIEAVDALETKLNDYSDIELSIEDRGYLDKIRAVNEQVRILTENSDPKTINYSSLTSLRDYINNATSYLNSWEGGASPTYLSSYAVGQIDEALNQIPFVSIAVNIPGAKAAIANLHRSVTRQNIIVNEITEKIKAKGSLADETIDEKMAGFVKEIEAQAAIAEEKLETIDTEADEISDRLDAVKLATSKLATEQNETFNTAQTDRTKQFEKMIKEQQEEAHGVFTSISEKVTTEVSDVKSQAQHSAHLADKARIKSEELLGIVSQNALINDYSKNGLHEQKWSRIWQIVTVLSLITAIIVGGYLAFDANDKTSWQKLVARLAVVVATSGLAAYAATQAAEHRQAQRHSEHLSLQLSAVRPYLADIDNDEDRDRLLLKLAERFFSEWKPKNSRQLQSKRKDINKAMISGDDLPGLIGAIINIVNTANRK